MHGGLVALLNARIGRGRERPRRGILAVLLGSLLALSGCLGARLEAATDLAGESFLADPAWALRALASGEGHDHASTGEHANLSTPNFDVVGYDPLVSTTLGATAGGHYCGDAQAAPDGRRIAAVESRVVGGFVFADVTDPTHPRWLGELILPTTRVYDLAVVPDGRHVALVTTDEFGAGPPVPGAAPDGILWRSSCAPDRLVPLRPNAAEDPLPRPSSLLLVDLTDTAQPRIIDQRPIPTAGHSVFSTRLDGRLLLLVTVTASFGRYYQFYEVLETPLGGRLNLLSTYPVSVPLGVPAPTVPPRTPRLSQGHDGWIAKHPRTGQTLAYLAGGTELTLLDVGNPYLPRFVGRWSDWAPEHSAYTGQLHSVRPLDETWAGRHYTLLGPEFAGHPGPRPSGTLWVLDTTDPTRPLEVGAWTLPHDPVWNGTYMFSNHYFTVHGRTAFISMYHGGVWAVDLSAVRPDRFVLLPSIGVFLPDRASPHPPASPQRWTPTVEDVIAFSDGAIVLFDGNSGLYVVRFDPSRPAAAPTPWPIEPVMRAT